MSIYPEKKIASNPVYGSVMREIKRLREGPGHCAASMDHPGGLVIFDQPLVDHPTLKEQIDARGWESDQRRLAIRFVEACYHDLMHPLQSVSDDVNQSSWAFFCAEAKQIVADFHDSGEAGELLIKHVEEGGDLSKRIS